MSNVNEPGSFDENGEMTTRAGDGELKFHFDHSFQETPLKGLMLYGIEVPPEGGDTLFADVRSAYHLLPEAVRERLASLTIRHSATVLPGSPTADHPLVWKHPGTGHPIFFFSQYHAVAILELSPEDSDALIKEFPRFIDRPQITYRHRWRRNDLLAWDNLALQHARSDFDPRYRRHLRRIQIGF
jgi:alpha-ketoglutarate-dependent taurine dioxygenase